MKQEVLVLVIFCCISSTLCEDIVGKNSSHLEDTNSLEGRRIAGGLHKIHGYHGLFHVFGLHALAILFWIKVKAVFVSFFVGMAVLWGFKFFFAKYNKGCSHDIIKEGGVIYDHPPAWAGIGHGHDHIPYSTDHDHHDHIPYSIDHDHHGHDEHTFDTFPTSDPYIGYSSSSYSDSLPPPTSHRRTVRSRQFESEDQISNLIFTIMGINSQACRRRFICEVEFKSQNHPMTRMAFRIVGRGIFTKYARDPYAEDTAVSFEDCARANSDCVFMDSDDNNNDNDDDPVHVDSHLGTDLNDNDISQNERNFKSSIAGKISSNDNSDIRENVESKSENVSPIADMIISRSKSN